MLNTHSHQQASAKVGWRNLQKVGYISWHLLQAHLAALFILLMASDAQVN